MRLEVSHDEADIEVTLEAGPLQLDVSLSVGSFELYEHQHAAGRVTVRLWPLVWGRARGYWPPNFEVAHCPPLVRYWHLGPVDVRILL